MFFGIQAGLTTVLSWITREFRAALQAYGAAYVHDEKISRVQRRFPLALWARIWHTNSVSSGTKKERQWQN